MFSCLGLSSNSQGDEEECEPLLPQYNDNTSLQTRVHEKLHTYQMLRAMSKGYMPSNNQAIVHLKTLLSSRALNPETPDLSGSGRALARTTSILIQQLVQLLQHKNSEDQLQDFIWYLTKSRLHIDTNAIASKSSGAKPTRDTVTAYTSLQTITSLLLTNSDFRIFLLDLETIGRQVFKDAALVTSDVSKKIGKQLEPSTKNQEAFKDESQAGQTPPSTEDLKTEAQDVANIVMRGAGEVAKEAERSAVDHITGDEQKALVYRLKQAVLKLRKQPDYSEAVSILSFLVRRYIGLYAQAAASTAEAVEDTFNTNSEADKALYNAWLMLTSIGDPEEWHHVENTFRAVVEHGRIDPDFDSLVGQLSNLIQQALTDPVFFENTNEHFEELREKITDITQRSSISGDIGALMTHLNSALDSVSKDQDIHNLTRTSYRLLSILSPERNFTNSDLWADCINIFFPAILQSIQYIPIPRLEVASPSIDLLLENLILEPGQTINHSSFLPFKLNLTTESNIEVTKGRFNTSSSMTTLVTLKFFGISIAGDDFGYWLRLHSGIFRFADQGLAGFHLDERGLDIAVDLEVGRDRIEEIISLRNVTVKIHHLDYTLGKSKFACLAWLFKPLVRLMVRKALELQISTSIADGLHTLNRELLFARERLRATRIANPSDMWTFIKAVATRLVPAKDPNVETRIGIMPGSGVFHGRYTPASVVKIWQDEGRGLEQRLFEYERGGWRNDVFDVKAVPVSQ